MTLTVILGIAHPTTVSPSSYVTPYTPLVSDAEEAAITLKAGEAVKIQLGAQIDGFGTIICNTIIVGAKPEELNSRQADLLLATHYANELLIRLLIPPGLLAGGSEDEKKKAATEKAPTQTKINSLLEKVAKSYDCHLVQNTTCWMFERNEIEGKKKIIIAPTEGMKGEGSSDLGEVWGIEMGMSLGSGKVKDLDKRPTLHRRTTITYGLKRPSSRQTLSEIVKKFGTFPFSLRQLEDERAGKVGVVECVRSNVLREYKPAGDAEGAPVARLLTTIGMFSRRTKSYRTTVLVANTQIAITKNGVTKLAAPPALDTAKLKTENKITDEEVLSILEKPIARSTGAKSKNKKKKKKPAKKAAEKEDEDDDDDDEDDEE